MKLNYLRTAAEHRLGSVACHRHLPQKKSHGSFLQSFLLLAALLLAGSGVSWGAEYTTKVELSFLNSSFEATGTKQAASDGGLTNAKISWSNIANETMQVGGNTYYKFSDDNAYINIAPYYYGVSAVFMPGDVVTVHMSTTANDVDGGFCIKTSGYAADGWQKITPNEDYAKSYTLTADDINDDGSITIYRLAWGSNLKYYSFEVTSKRHTVTFSGVNGGNVTATANGKSLTSGEQVGDNTEVTFTATPTGTNLPWKWIIDGTDKFSQDPQTITVNQDITVNHEFGSVYVNVYTNNANYGTVNIKHGDQNATTFHVTPWAGEFTLTATATANGKFMGWYKDADHTQKIDGAEATYTVTNPSGTNNYFAYFVEGANTITKPGCGGYYMDQSKLNAGTATLNVSGGKGTVVTGASGGYVSVKFDQAYSFTNLKRYTVSGTNVATNLNNVEFLKNGVGITGGNFYSGCSDKDLTVENKNSVLTSVDEIRFHFKENTTTTIDYIYFEVDHGPRTKPTLANPTAAEMKIFSDETLQLRITNTAGFWREYTNDQYNTETFTHIGHNANGEAEYKPSYDISNLTPGDYYFGIKDGGNCTENNKYHESGLVKVHVKVIESIASIDVKGTKRYYDVYAPSGITSSESSKVGVVISLHGASNDYDNGRVDFDAIARNEVNTDKKFVVVYPRGLMRQLRGQERGWESYTESNTEDVDFFKEIVKELKKTYTVDDERIYLAGFSNGGMMAYKAAHQAGDFFAAFASVGGFPVNESHLWHAGKQPTPFIHIQGEDDTVFPSATYDVNTIIHNMVYRNGAQFNPWETSNGRVSQDGGMITLTDAQGTKDCHSAEAGGADYFFYKIKGLGHWCSKDWTGDGVDDIASTMWTFFNKADKTKSLDKSLKFRVNADDFFANAVSCGFTDVNTGKSVLSYGGYTKTDANKNVYHDLQFKGGAHYLKLNMETEKKTTEDKSEFFMVTLTKTGASTPIFSKRYQAGRGKKDLYINFTALDGYNEYKLTIIKSSESLEVKVNNIEFHSGYCEDAGAVENPTAFYTIDEVVGDMKPIYQPVYGKTYGGLAKEYIPIADIPANDKVTISDNLGVEKLASSITTDTKGRFANTAISGKDGEDTTHKSKNVYIIGTGEINTTNGFNISAQGRAKMPEYLAGTEISFPTKGVLAMQVQGTLDLTFLSYNVNGTDANRRMLKAYYTNDQLDGELKELKSWDFYGTRNEDNANGLQPLNLSIRMQHLGQDGTCKVFVSYEGHQSNGVLVQDDADNDDVWIKGIVVKRPDLKVTIGRTDKLRYTNGDSNNDNCDLTCFGENKPYQWNFGTAGFTNTKKSDLEKKKVNQFDGRTYISGVGPNGEELKDHVLVYSEGLAGDNEKAKVQFDGRPSNGKHKGYEDDATDNNEHIEFTNPTVYTIDANRRDMFPVESNGLKVNVTGSGWFTVAASAPNGRVRMKILSSNNGGTAYTNVLREFVVDNENDADKGQAGYNKETSWKTYRVYLKAHTDKDGTQGFWHGNDKEIRAKKNNRDIGVITDPEMMQMSLYVVFDKMGDDYKDPKTNEAATPQLNVHYMQWINELPADYVFQQEEDPSLLNSLQHIKGNGTDEKPDLYWQAGTSLVEEQKTITPTYSDGSGTYNAVTYKSAYNSRSYTDREGGETSDPDDISAGLGCTWNVGAMPNTKAHTEENYATHGKSYDSFNLLYDKDKAKNNDGANSDKNHEFAIPVSGSFLRFMPMKNQFISAWIVPQDSVASTIYVLDETGEPIPYCEGAGYGDVDDKSKVTQAARERGWVNKADGLTKPEIDGDSYPSIFGATATSNAARIDFAALAGKEYFIVANGDGAISLARLQATDNSSRAETEELSSELTLVDRETNNKSKIAAVMNDGVGRHATASKPIQLTGRTFAENTWTSLVLPFSMNEKKFEEVFGEGAKCLHFTKVETNNDNTIVFTHHYYNMIVAGRPVFIYPTKKVENPVFTDVTLSAKEEKPTTCEGFTFVASYDNTTINKNDLFMNNKGSVSYWTGNDNTSYPGMRSFVKNKCYWDFSTGVTTANQTKAVFLNFDEIADENISTSIEEFVRGEFGENAVVITKSTKAYDLNGRAVADGADINNLPAGIYIVNGKKFIVK